MGEQAAAGTPFDSNQQWFLYICTLKTAYRRLEKDIFRKSRGMQSQRNRRQACLSGCFEETIYRRYERDEAKRNRAKDRHIPSDD